MRKKKVRFSDDDFVYNVLFNDQLDKFYYRLDEYQKKMYESILKYKVVIVDEPAGTGKTTIAVYAGINALQKGKKLVYIRFPSRLGEQLGFTPGDLENKEFKYMFPFYEALNEFGFQDEVIFELKNKGLIETRTDTTERGRNLKNCFVIIDESQNAKDIGQLQLILTRIHDDSSVVMVGHSGQTDQIVKTYGKKKLNAFQVYTNHLLKKNWAVKCNLLRNYRGEIAKWADAVNESINEL